MCVCVCVCVCVRASASLLDVAKKMLNEVLYYVYIISRVHCAQVRLYRYFAVLINF